MRVRVGLIESMRGNPKVCPIRKFTYMVLDVIGPEMPLFLPMWISYFLEMSLYYPHFRIPVLNLSHFHVNKRLGIYFFNSI